jgi:hypothetical protein
MTIKLPTPLRTYQYRPLTVFSLLDTDTDRVLPQLFETCVKGGRSSRSRTRAGDFAGYRDAMLAAGGLVGFDDDDDRALLDGWLRSCVVEMGAVGRSNSGEQMLAVAPLTLAAYRSGLPVKRDRHRGIDDTVYHLLVDALGRSGSASPVSDLRDLVVASVGGGLQIGPQPRWEPRLGDVSQLDIGALLEFRFVEGFEMLDAVPVEQASADSPLPAVAAQLGDLLLAHLRVYDRRLPVPALMGGFAALMALGVFTFSLRVDAAARLLLRGGELPADMRPGGPPPAELELYCDFTGDLGGVSDGLTRRCVERDLDRVRLAFRDRMTFVVVNEALKRIPDELAQRDQLSRPERLAQLAALQTHRRVESYASGRIDDLVADAAADDQVTDPERDFLRATQSRDADELGKLLDILAYVNEGRATTNAVRWYWSVGGLDKPYGLLRGTSNSRRSWRYAPGDELLHALLLAVFVDSTGRSARSEMPLRDVLMALEQRFGILVNRPPAFLDGAEARRAAAANLDAFKARLTLLGCFDSLSDDFSVQVVRHPLGDA